MDVVSCHISNEVNAHQCAQSSGRLHYNSNRASAHSVVDPVNVTESRLNQIFSKSNSVFLFFFKAIQAKQWYVPMPIMSCQSFVKFDIFSSESENVFSSCKK